MEVGFALRLDADADAKLFLLGQVADLGRKIDHAPRFKIVPGLLNVGRQGVAEFFFQRHVFARQIQYQLVSLQRGREPPFAGDAGGVVHAFQVAERPVVVDHFQLAANVVNRIGKLAVADRTAVGVYQQMLVHGLVRDVAPGAIIEVDRSARIERLDDLARSSRAGPG